MKKEKFKKKLVLNKLSIAQLDKDKVNKIKSGEQPPSTGVPTCNLVRVGCCAGCP